MKCLMTPWCSLEHIDINWLGGKFKTENQSHILKKMTPTLYTSKTLIMTTWHLFISAPISACYLSDKTPNNDVSSDVTSETDHNHDVT